MSAVDVSMPKRVKIQVTLRDIKNGKRRNDFACAITLAARRTFGKLGVTTTPSFIHVRVEGPGLIWYKLPLKARKFIHNFDNKKPVDPMSFVAIRGNLTLHNHIGLV